MKGSKARITISFKRKGNLYRASASLSDLGSFNSDPAEIMKAASDAYKLALLEMKQWRKEFKALQQDRTPLMAKEAWELGDVLHRLHAKLATLGCRLEDPYGHLKRHAGVPQKWLGQFVTFRRYVNAQDSIPKELKWHTVAKTAKTAGLSIADGNLVEV